MMPKELQDWMKQMVETQPIPSDTLDPLWKLFKENPGKSFVICPEGWTAEEWIKYRENKHIKNM